MRLLKGIFVGVLMILAETTGADIRHTIGLARDAEDQSLRYIEHHQYLDEETHLVRYFDADLDLILTKEISYPGLPQHPVIIQRDFVNETDIVFEHFEGMATMIRENRNDRQEFSFELADNIIIDAGFDAFIRENWEALSNDRPRRYKMAIVGQSRLLSVNVSLESRTLETSTFSIRPVNWLVRLLLPEVRLTYDSDRRLLTYRGLSNLKPGPSESRAVTIDFDHYALDSSLEMPLSQWIRP